MADCGTMVWKSELHVSEMRVVVRKIACRTGSGMGNAALGDTSCGGDEDEVNLLALLFGNLSPIVERPFHALTLLGDFMGIAEHEFVGGNGAVSLALVVDVEVTGKDGRLVAHDAAYAVDDEESGLSASLGADVVEVGVHGHKYAPGVAFAQLRPRGNAAACAVPSDEAHGIGILREPEGIAAEKFETVLLVENGGRLTGTVAIVAADPDEAVFGQAFLEVGKLVVKHLLTAHDVEVMMLDEGCHRILAVLPVVQTVLRIVVTDVEGGTVEGKGRSLLVGTGGKRPCTQGYEGKENMFVHNLAGMKYDEIRLLKVGSIN